MLCVGVALLCLALLSFALRCYALLRFTLRGIVFLCFALRCYAWLCVVSLRVALRCCAQNLIELGSLGRWWAPGGLEHPRVCNYQYLERVPGPRKTT